MKKNFSWKKAVGALVATSVVLSAGIPTSAASAAEKGTAKNVILMIPDGMGASYMTASRIFKGEELSFERYMKGMMKTYSADTSVTDSAAAGTAMATGYKTDNGMISVTPDGEQPDSILDAARNKDKATGLVATSRITHATPAVFTSHDPSRGNEAVLAQQYINNVDVILGGGRDMFTLEKDGGNQTDRDLVAEAKDAGYEYVTEKSQLDSVEGNKVLGLFADAALTYDIDRVDQEQPSLTDMTEFAIDTLSKDEDGFFLMVEGSQIDWAGHANDPVAAITDTLEFDRAVEKALDFAKKDKNTLVVVVGDHETGGMNVGTTEGGYADNIDVLKNIKMSNNVLATKLAEEADVISIKNAKESEGNYYLPIRDAAKELGAKFSFNSKSGKATVTLDGAKATIDLLKRTTAVKGEKGRIGIVKTPGVNHVDFQDFTELFGLQAGYQIGDNKADNKAYVVDAESVLEKHTKLDINDADLELLTSQPWDGSTLVNTLGTIISNHAYISWGTRNHSGVEVPLYAYGKGSDQFVGLINNTDLPRIISYLQGTELFEDEQAFIDEMEERRNQ